LLRKRKREKREIKQERIKKVRGKGERKKLRGGCDAVSSRTYVPPSSDPSSKGRAPMR
jgi:hypothetical protein